MKKILFLLPVLLLFLCGCVAAEEKLLNPVHIDEKNIFQDVVVGVALPLSGKYASRGHEMVPGARAAVESVNLKRGIAGRRVRLEICDTKSDSAGAVLAMKELARRGASVVIGGYATTETHGLAAAAEELRIPLIIPCASADKFSQVNPFVFRISCTDTQQAEGLAAYLWYWRQIRQIGVLIDMNPASEYERNVARCTAQSFAALGGAVVKTSDYKDIPSCVKAIREIMTYGPQAIVVTAIGEDAAMMIKALRKLGYSGVICGTDGWEGAEFSKALGKDVHPGECFFVSFFSEEYKDDEFAAFSDFFSKRYYHRPGAHATAVRDAIVMACNSIANTGDIRRFRRNWLAMQNFFGAASIYNPLKSGNVDRMIFINSISPAGTDAEYPKARLIRGFLHSKLESYRFD